MIVKPAREGSTIGLTKVTSPSSASRPMRWRRNTTPRCCANSSSPAMKPPAPVLGEGASAQALPVIRIVAPEGNYDYQNKYFTDDTQYHCPSGLPEAKKAPSSAWC
jgi:D-alanine-D-alanine ligase